jgi:hypothetical protein
LRTGAQRQDRTPVGVTLGGPRITVAHPRAILRKLPLPISIKQERSHLAKGAGEQRSLRAGEHLLEPLHLRRCERQGRPPERVAQLPLCAPTLLHAAEPTRGVPE